MAKHFKWNFDKIAIYPFGGCTKFNEKINKSLKEELLILINGPLFQILLYIIVIILNIKGIITTRSLNLFKNYHYTLLIFNLLPIYPLDGGRILNIIMNYLLPYKKGNKIVILISIILTLTLILLYNSLNYILMSILLITEIIIYLKRQNYLYNKMLLERYITPPKKGDIVKTSGLGNLPKNISIGIVDKIKKDDYKISYILYITPSQNMNDLTYVGVLTNKWYI